MNNDEEDEIQSKYIHMLTSMHALPNKIRVILFLIAVVGVIHLVQLSQRHAEPPRQLSALEKFEIDQQHWRDRITEVGGEAAYREFSADVSLLSTLGQHDQAHLFGEALFQVLGLEGIAVCDGRYVYGCFHAFMIEGIEEKGVGSVKALNDACVQALGESAQHCQHGIGHGILGSLGYDKEDLHNALKTCSTLDHSDPITGCNGGVFMEFDLRGMQRGEMKYRAFSATTKLEPCETVDDVFWASCAYWKPMWWIATHPQRDVDLARQMGLWCMQLPGAEETLAACINGIANKMQQLTDEDPSKTQIMCEAATNDPKLQYDCHVGSAARFTFYYPLERALVACSGLGTLDEEKCRIAATSRVKKLINDKSFHDFE